MIITTIKLLVFCVGIVTTFNFELVNPVYHTEILSGTQMPIKWILNNVSLPLPDVNVNIDLLRVGTPDTYFMSIAEHAPNNGEYIWNMPADLRLYELGFKMKISVSQFYNLHVPFTSAPFFIRQESGYRMGSISVIEPPVNTVIYPGQEISIKWTKGADLPSFPWGVHLEVRLPFGGSVLTLGRNITFNSNVEGEFKWKVPEKPFSDLEAHMFKGRFFIWGYDINRRALVHGDNGIVSVNYIDQVILALSFITPKETDIATVETDFNLVLAMVEKNTGVPVSGRNTIVTMYLEDELERQVFQIFKDYAISEKDWQGGTAMIKWRVPSKKDLNLDGTNAKVSGQQVVRTESAKRFRIKYYASYEAKQPGKRIDVVGESKYFTISTDGKPPDGSSAQTLVGPFNALMIALLFLNY